MDKHSEAFLRNMLGELQPDEPVAGSGVESQSCGRNTRHIE